ncbi:hypothetical protein ATO12_17115 [Aquimarina atlantica]|uniref:Uncharacterized protein n=1 Tax=Aquimarina atlantica TaxID=1317122 RepID=A0A023BUH7_9FLAO|nr:hypothetical protein [Aquimarina atlantica]EZH73656.1 hypothetical protein ATO12_17115 [Aquimarina atlantica]
MANLEFTPFLPQENVPERFSEFRKLASSNKELQDVKGEIVFNYVSQYKQFDIEKNTTNISYKRLREIFDNEHLNFII